MSKQLFSQQLAGYPEELKLQESLLDTSNKRQIAYSVEMVNLHYSLEFAFSILLVYITGKKCYQN